MAHTCHKCGKVFTNSSSLTRHLQTVHHEKVDCQYCHIPKSVRVLGEHEATCSLRTAAQPQALPAAPQRMLTAAFPPPPPPDVVPPPGIICLTPHIRVWSNHQGAVYAYDTNTHESFWITPTMQRAHDQGDRADQPLAETSTTTTVDIHQQDDAIDPELGEGEPSVIVESGSQDI